ncbi:MAG: hypothetical protein JWP89_1657 [Schlesneria sp.]|nr:hypothetical protein [Schlesneria sp.]
MKTQLQNGLLCAAIGIGASCFVLSASSARHAAAQTDPARITWEYTTANIDTGSLQTKLTELGNAGWDVFAVSAADSKVETGADGTPHVAVLRMDVTAKRSKLK